MRWGLPPIPVRPASAREPRLYLADPAFSTCTVPVVYFQHNSFNYAHTFRDNAARVFSALRETPWAPHAKLMLQTGGGLTISGMNLALWQPLTNMSVDSLAEASVRLADEQARAAASARLPPRCRSCRCNRCCCCCCSQPACPPLLP